MAEGGAARAPHRPRGGRRGAGGGAGLAAGSGRRAALAGAHEEVSWRPRNSAKGGGGLGLWVRPPNRASATSVHTVPLAKPATRLADCLQLKRSKHITPCAPRPPLRSPAAASCARAGDSVRGVDMCRSCIDEGDGNTADTGLSRWRAAGRTHCASAHGARRTQSGPPSLKHSD